MDGNEKESAGKRQDIYRASKRDFTLKAIFPAYDLLLRTRIASRVETLSSRLRYRGDIISKIEHTVSACCFKERVSRKEDESLLFQRDEKINIGSITYHETFLLKNDSYVNYNCDSFQWFLYSSDYKSDRVTSTNRKNVKNNIIFLGNEF